MNEDGTVAGIHTFCLLVAHSECSSPTNITTITEVKDTNVDRNSQEFLSLK